MNHDERLTLNIPFYEHPECVKKLKIKVYFKLPIVLKSIQNLIIVHITASVKTTSIREILAIYIY